MSDLGKLYQKNILEHDRAPRHAAAVPSPTHRAEASNPLCGDRIVLTLSVIEGRIADIGCEVRGCAICRASGSMLAERVMASELVEALALSRRFIAAATAPAADVLPSPAAASEAWGPLAALLEARRYPNRQRCATLPWEALEHAAKPEASGLGQQS